MTGGESQTLSTPVETPVGNHAADVDAVWAAASALLRERLSDGAWKMWFSGVRAVEVHDGTIILAVPSRMARDHLAASYSETIRDVLRAATAHDHVLEFVIQREPGDDLAPEPLLPEPPPEPAPSAPGTDRFVPDENTLNPRYTFDAFVIGASNRFAHAAALSVAEQPASSYNPLFIYGRAGLGKTHLLHGIGHYLREVYTKLRVRYVSTESFMNEFVEAIRTNTMNSFKPRYREVDVLLVDDIQFLEERERLQEEFFHTFN